MGTIEKDEATILRVLEGRPNGIRSSELFHRVRGSVRSLTTYQKRLRHLEKAGRIRIEVDINDPRARLITSTVLTKEARILLEAIDLLGKAYLGKSIEGFPSANAADEQRMLMSDLLIEVAHKKYMEINGEQFLKPLGLSKLSDLPEMYICASRDGRSLDFIARPSFDRMKENSDRYAAILSAAKSNPQLASLLRDVVANTR